MSKLLALSLAIVTFIAGMGVGYVLTPEYATANNEMAEDMGLGKADKYLDLRYLNKMAIHHRAAMLLAEQAQEHSKRKEVQDLAKDILTNEPKLIDELYMWKSDWYKDKSKVRDPQVANLGTYDENFDLRFLNALIAHHKEGVDMANEAKTKSSRNEILDNANTVGEFLSGGVTMLSEWREEWYNIK